MRNTLIAFLTAASLALPAAGQAANAPDGGGDIITLPTDGSTTVGGVEAACTGIGQTRNDPRWAQYAVRVEVSDARTNYLADAVIAVSDSRGRQMLRVFCDSPWVLLDLPPGAYTVRATLNSVPTARPRSAAIRAPARGQLRVVLQFPDA